MAHYQAGAYGVALLEFQKAAEQGYAGAQYQLGVMHEMGQGTASVPPEALKWFRRAAEQGHAEAQFKVGKMNPVYGNGKDTDAQDWFRRAAEQGHAEAQYMVGLLSADPAEAVKWLQRAAEQGSADAQFMLGTRYKTGFGVPRDEVAAQMWFRAAANQGHGYAKKQLEQM